jgi:hypothetical protein
VDTLIEERITARAVPIEHAQQAVRFLQQQHLEQQQQVDDPLFQHQQGLQRDQQQQQQPGVERLPTPPLRGVPAAPAVATSPATAAASAQLPTWQPFTDVDSLIRSHPSNPWPRPPRAPAFPRVLQHFPGHNFDTLRRAPDARALNEGRLIFSIGSFNYDLIASISTVVNNIVESEEEWLSAAAVVHILSLITCQLEGIHTLAHERTGYLVTLAQHPAARDFLVRAQQQVEWSEQSEPTHIQQALQDYLDATRTRRPAQPPFPQQQQQQQQQQQAPPPLVPGGRGQPGAGRGGRGGGRGRGR